MADDDKKRGRPLGSTSLGIPRKSIQEAVVIIGKLYAAFGLNTMSFKDDILNLLSLEKAGATPLMGTLSTDYGFIQKSENGWKITEIGEKAANGDPVALKEAFEKNSLFNDLSNRYWDKEVTVGLIMDYIRKNYKKGGNASLIASKFVESMVFIKALDNASHAPVIKTLETAKIKADLGDAKWLKIIQLKYALKPPTIDDKKKLATSIAEDFKNDNDAGIRSLANMIEKYKDNDDILVGFIDDLLTELQKRYPNLPELENDDTNAFEDAYNETKKKK